MGVILTFFPLPSGGRASRPSIVHYGSRQRATQKCHRLAPGGKIELLQEYRTRLIADVVTGKLDVREAAARLPDEPDDEDGTEADDPVEDVAGELARADAV